MSVIFKIFIFFAKNRDKSKQNSFILKRARQGLTSFLRISVRDGESGLRSSMGRKLFVDC